MSSHDLSLTELLDALESASARYRAHASRDASWVNTWTGEADPELLEIEALIQALVSHDMSPEQVPMWLDRLLEVRDEPIVAQALVEALLATTHATLRPELLARAVAIVQDVEADPPVATPWLAQALFWSAQEIEDLELCVVLLGDASRLFGALPLWLATPRAHPHTHLFATLPADAVVWIEGFLDVCIERHDVDVLQGVALAFGMTRSEQAHAGLTRLLTSRLDEATTPEEIVEPDAAIAAVLEALGAIPEPLDEPDVLCDVLATPAHGDACADLLSRDGAIRVPVLSALLSRTTQPDRITVRVRACRALRHMPRPTPEADEVLLMLTQDGAAPIRHMALYALVERDYATIVERLETMIRDESDGLEAEELLFILATHPSEKIKELIQELSNASLPSSLDLELFDEALAAWHEHDPHQPSNA